MNGTTDTTSDLSALQAIPGTDIAAALIRIAEALEKQNVLTEELTSSIDYIRQAIFHVGANL